MKILFLENRHKTFFFELIANNLKQLGHEIHWLVQNRQFAPSDGFYKFIMEYPSKSNLKYGKDEAVENIIEGDRQINFFNKKDRSYFYYYNDIIESYLIKLKPDFVFGESTAFHELLTIENCKKQDILYLNPSTCRYPTGRFSFYKYDTLDPYLGSNELLSKSQAEEVINDITNRKKAPDYMKALSVSKVKIVLDKAKKTYAYLDGERYNTPSPLNKFKVEKTKEQNIQVWDSDALKEIKSDTLFKVLYPLQMQPEANIDVWGKKYRNQTLLIKQIVESLPSNCVLYVKPNPKSKYELSSDLINLISSKENIKHLHHSAKMNFILPQIDLIITVTGTIAIESILNNKPIVTMVKTINNNAENCIYIENLKKDLEPIIDSVKNNTFNSISNLDKVYFINTLNSTSYKGVVSDHYSDQYCISKTNIKDIVKAFNHVLTETNL